MAEMIDFDNLTAAEVDALDGFEREAWYAWITDDKDEAARIMGLYEHSADEDPRDVEVPDEPADELSGKALQEAKRAAARSAEVTVAPAAEVVV